MNLQPILSLVYACKDNDEAISEALPSLMKLLSTKEIYQNVKMMIRRGEHIPLLRIVLQAPKTMNSGVKLENWFKTEFKLLLQEDSSFGGEYSDILKDAYWESVSTSPTSKKYEILVNLIFDKSKNKNNRGELLKMVKILEKYEPLPPYNHEHAYPREVEYAPHYKQGGGDATSKIGIISFLWNILSPPK